MKKNLILIAIMLMLPFSGKAQINTELVDEGNFYLSCNYWASNAGTAMWRNWDPEAVENDFKKLSEAGITVLRVFPNWEDFQPIKAARNAGGGIVDYRFNPGDTPLPEEGPGANGVSEVMIERMRTMLDLGSKYNIKFVIALLTGHMSGRVFLPPAIQGANPLTDPHSIRWELKFIDTMVSELKDHEAILGWGLGNESNCMGGLSRNQAYIWTSMIANAIRKADPSRPVLSDMHGLSPEGTWSMIDQGELTDILTTHPYPLFTGYCDGEPLNTMRPIIHGAAESTYYRDLSRKPVIVEEMGSLGTMISNEEIQADFFRTATFSSLANNCHTTMWWCSSDFKHLDEPPYDWQPFETELGMFHSDGSPKPIVAEMKKFSDFYQKFPYKNLPEIKKDVLCILTKNQDTWAVAQSAFCLGKMAGLNVEYQFVEQPLRDADIYFLPSLNGFHAIKKTKLQQIMKKVEEGATLYISMGDTYICDFENITGIRVNTRMGHGNAVTFQYADETLRLPTNVTYTMESTKAKVISATEEGRPVLTENTYGKGKVILLAANLEQSLAGNSDFYLHPENNPLWKIYRNLFAEKIQENHIITKNDPMLALSEHYINENKCVVIAINYSPKDIQDQLTLKEGWKISKTWYGKKLGKKNGNQLDITVPYNNAMIFELIN